MKIAYQQLFDILWKARRAYKEDYKEFLQNSDLEGVKFVEEMLKLINESSAYEFYIDEMPF